MTNIQKASFFNSAVSFVAKKNPHKLTGTRLLAPYAGLIASGVKMGLNQKQIAKCLSNIPNGPFDNNKQSIYLLSQVTRTIYVSQACIELNITRRNKG